MLLAVAGGLIVAAVRHTRETAGGPAKESRRFADLVLDGLGERDLLVTDGAIDGLLRFRAWSRRQPLLLLGRSALLDPFHRRHVLEQARGPVLRGLAPTGLTPLFREWLRVDPGVRGRSAALGLPLLWDAVGIEGVSDGLLYVAETEPVAPAPPLALTVRLREAPEALLYYGGGHARGKVVITL